MSTRLKIMVTPPLHGAAARNNEELADSLINKEAERDIENEDGNTPIDPADMHSANRVYNLLKEIEEVNGD
ncbi:MAG: ankyrin repeat domain-containing protein [Planctomycetota bacterium]